MKARKVPLVPPPQEAAAGGEGWTLPREIPIRAAPGSPAAEPALRRLEGIVTSLGLATRRAEPSGAGPAGISLRLSPESHPRPEAYELAVDASGARISATTAAGLFHGAGTLGQWLRLHRPRKGGPPGTPGLTVRDWPDLGHRGVMLDVSRDKVPSLQTLKDLVDLLADWKVNQLQLYMEHTFAYQGHEAVWRGASPLTPEEVRELDADCRDRFIELVPNQNSFGHLHRWLIHEPYRRLAECPEGIDHPFADRREPFSLCPLDPGSLDLLADLYDQLLPCFTSRLFNVGMDETFDLGLCRSAAACAQRGRGKVYLDFLLEVHRLVSERGRRMQFWGDILVGHPELAAGLPRDVIGLEWGYEADHPFGDRAARYAESGLDFYLCPGTSSWNSIAGRLRNAVENISRAALSGRSAGASGLLVTDWGDHGHLQPLPVSYAGLLLGAAFAWNAGAAEAPEDLGLAELLDLHAFRDRAGVVGRTILDLGNAYLRPGPTPPNASILFHLLRFAGEPLTPPRFAGLTPAGLKGTESHLEEALARLHRARIERPDAGLVLEELRWAGDLLRFACRLGRARFRWGPDLPLGQLPHEVRKSLVEELQDLTGRHREIWLARNRVGGLGDSADRLERILRLFG